MLIVWPAVSAVEKVVGLAGFMIIQVFIATFSPAQGERNQMVNTKFTRPVNEMPMSNRQCCPISRSFGRARVRVKETKACGREIPSLHLSIFRCRAKSIFSLSCPPIGAGMWKEGDMDYYSNYVRRCLLSGGGVSIQRVAK